MNWFTKRMLRWLQRKCDHRAMVADVMEGNALPRQVAWCPTCGMVCVHLDHGNLPGNARRCEPTWS